MKYLGTRSTRWLGTVVSVTAMLTATGQAGAARSGGVPHVETTVKGVVKAQLAYLKTVTVTGHFTYQGKSHAITDTTYANLRASVFVGGHLVVSDLFPKNLSPFSPNNGKAIHVEDIEAPSTPSVLVDLYTGGAHCCFKTWIYLLSGNRLAGRIRVDWGDPGYTLRDLNGDGVAEFVSANDAFAYAFTDFADSSFPIQVWDIENGKLVDTTVSYPKAIATDAAAQLKSYQQARRSNSDVRGVLAAYVADEALLGTPSVGWDLVNNALAIGGLDQGYGGAKGNQYIAALRRFLTSHGYMS
jgi:hypothetical protein